MMKKLTKRSRLFDFGLKSCIKEIHHLMERESKSRAFGTDITNYTGSKRYQNDSSSDWSSKASTTQRNLYLACSRLPLPYLQMGQLQSELRVARSLLAEKETEIQGNKGK
nr:hypothetical protein [Tanacetum cinerariifolium]